MAFDRIYTQLTNLVPYRILMAIPAVFVVISLALIFTRGIPLGIDFKGGTWMDAVSDRSIGDAEKSQLTVELEGIGLEDLRVYVGRDVASSKNKVTIVTTTVVNEAVVRGIVSKYTGELFDYDVATAQMGGKPSVELKEKLTVRLREHVDVEYGDGTLKITALDLDETELESALKYYLNQDLDATVQKKNFNIRSVGPTLGKTFREQGINAMIMAFILMGFVIFIAFKDPIPSIAAILAAASDVVIAMGFMSLLNIDLEPASLAALLMLLGYSIDTDVLLTARVFKERSSEEVNARIDDTIITGLTMTGTTMAALIVLYVVSGTLTNIPILRSISSVLFLGLIADVFTTWFTNTGILKWYLEKPGRRRFKLPFIK